MGRAGEWDSNPDSQASRNLGLGLVVDAEMLGSCLFERVGEHVYRLSVLAEVLGDVSLGVGSCGDGVDPVRLPPS